MKLVTNVNHFTLSQSVDVVDDNGNSVFSTASTIGDVENVIESLCSQYNIEDVYISGAQNFIQKIGNDLSRKTTFNKNNIKIHMI